MAAHQQLGQLAIALTQGLHDLAMLPQRGKGALGVTAGAVTAHAQQLVLLACQQIDQHLVSAAAHNLIMEVEITLVLRIGFSTLLTNLFPCLGV